jgi:hypothetical protein
MTGPADRPAVDLRRCVSDLGAGDWAGVLAEVRERRSDGSWPATEFALSVWDLAVCLRCRAFGELDEAASCLRKVTARMPARARGRQMGRCGYRLAVLEEPGSAGPSRLAWQLYCVAYREQREFTEACARCAGDDRRSRYDQMITACVHFLTWRDLCPFARQPGPETRGLDLRRNRHPVEALINAYRRFAVPRRGDLPVTVWRWFDGFEELQVEALRQLAGTVLPADTPVRAGHRAAWEMARRHFR